MGEAAWQGLTCELGISGVVDRNLSLVGLQSPSLQPAIVRLTNDDYCVPSSSHEPLPIFAQPFFGDILTSRLAISLSNHLVALSAFSPIRFAIRAYCHESSPPLLVKVAAT
jgi:hypothetical protein